MYMQMNEPAINPGHYFTITIERIAGEKTRLDLSILVI